MVLVVVRLICGFMNVIIIKLNETEMLKLSLWLWTGVLADR